MIISFIFFLHIIFSLVIFTKKWQDEKISIAFLNVGLIAIIFAVGWSIASMVAKLILEPAGFGIHFDRDTFSLALLTIGEYFFYKIYYKPDFATEVDMEKL